MAEYIITLTAVRFTILKPEYEHFHFILTHKCAMMKGWQICIINFNF